MLHIIRGRAGSGKSDYFREIIKNLLTDVNEKPVLIVPEQFSFETERSYLSFLGAKNMRRLTVCGFSRLAVSEVRKNNLADKPFISDGVRKVIMRETLSTLEGRLNVFGKIGDGERALNSLVSIVSEMKLCCISESDLFSISESMERSLLKEKLSELSLILGTYNALVSNSFFDDSDALTVFNKYAADSCYFDGKTVFVDAFRSFSKQELIIITTAMSQAKEVYISLCTDRNGESETPFAFVDEFENKIRAYAKENNVHISEPKTLEVSDVYSHDIAFLEKNLYSDEPESTDETDGSVIVAECTDIEDECSFVTGEIRRLLRTGQYRCRDIAVIERTNGTYKQQIIDKLHRLSVPVFDDSRRPLATEAVILYILSVLDCISDNFKTESVMTYLKSGLSELSLTEVSELEKYAVIWEINGKAWLNDFLMNPNGFGSVMDEKAAAKLERLNALRKKAIIPLMVLKKNCEDKSGADISKAVYDFLVSEKINDRLFDICSSLGNDGFMVEAKRQEKAWSVLMNIIDTVSDLLGDRITDIKQFAKIFGILVASTDIGEIPQGLDEVTVGSADRIRTEQLKVVFLVGVNKDEFPLVSVKSGILTDSDRKTLCEIGVEVKPPFEKTINEERFIAYCAVTAAHKKLYFSYKTVSDGDNEAIPSEIIKNVEACLKSVTVIKTKELSAVERIESDENAFTAFASVYNKNTAERASLYAYLSSNDEFSGKLNSIELLNGNSERKFENPDISKALFGKTLNLSASRVESFYRCPFSYFLRYGLKMEPVKTAELDPAVSGTVIHYVFEKVLSKYRGESFLKVDDDELKQCVCEILSDYLKTYMGGFSDKSARFLYLYNRLVEIVMTVFYRLKQEFAVSDFLPCDFELKIGGDKIPPYSLPLSDGEVKITGSIDRVDLMEKDGIKYLRVIDYKTGMKDFKLSDLLDGLNIQMVLYLMSLVKDGVDYYGEAVPAGVIYLPSKIGISNYLNLRSPSQENIDAQKQSSGKLIGMVLDSPVVVNGMGGDKMKNYLPVSFKKNGDISGKSYSQKEFSNLSKVIDNEIISMGEKLHNGEIDAYPYGDKVSAEPCKYCSYRCVCGYEDGDKIRSLSALSHAEALKVLDGDSNE